MTSKTKLVRDTVHGYIKVPSTYFVDFIDTPVFQRLRSIEQTSIRVLYPSAHHDRFVHSLGAFHLAQVVFRSLKERDQLGDVRSEASLGDSFQIAALLHDCAHSPFSHTGEEFTKQLHKSANEEELLKLANDATFAEDFRHSTQTPAIHLESAINDLGDALSEAGNSPDSDDALRPLFSLDALCEPAKMEAGFTAYLPCDGDIRFLFKQFCQNSGAAKELLERSHSQRPAWKTFSEFAHHFRTPLASPADGKWQQNAEPFLARTEPLVQEESWGTYCRVAPKLSMSTLGNMPIVIDKDASPCTYDSIFGRSNSPVCPYCYIYLNGNVDAKNVIGRLKAVAREVASSTFFQG